MSVLRPGVCCIPRRTHIHGQLRNWQLRNFDSPLKKIIFYTEISVEHTLPRVSIGQPSTAAVSAVTVLDYNTVLPSGPSNISAKYLVQYNTSAAASTRYVLPGTSTWYSTGTYRPQHQYERCNQALYQIVLAVSVLYY